MPGQDLHAQLIELLPRLRRFARALARNAADADDLVQLALERALSRAGQMRADASLAGWMFGILRNAWIDELRTRARRARLLAPADTVEEVGDASQSGEHAELLSVQEALARLPEEQRSAVALVLIEGLSYKEAAHVMQVPIGTLTSRLARGRETLQQMLGEA
ncbi:MAG: sigma-70 family RNA polymerase sigma factor [Gammaproteobacteria bacterium]|nr:sigma-70 family RNA polymerase sigma factor [Gammaproteobacteria bacterium]